MPSPQNYTSGHRSPLSWVFHSLKAAVCGRNWSFNHLSPTCLWLWKPSGEAGDLTCWQTRWRPRCCGRRASSAPTWPPPNAHPATWPLSVAPSHVPSNPGRKNEGTAPQIISPRLPLCFFRQQRRKQFYEQPPPQMFHKLWCWLPAEIFQLRLPSENRGLRVGCARSNARE